MKVLIDGQEVTVESSGLLDIASISAFENSVLVYRQAGRTIIAAVNGSGQSRCREGTSYTLQHFRSQEESRSKKRDRRAKKGEDDQPKDKAAKPHRLSKYNEFMRLYLDRYGNKWFLEGAVAWKSLTKEQQKTVAVEALVNAVRGPTA